MADAAKEAVSFVAGKSRNSLAEDRALTLALVKCIEIVGEAANGVSETYRSKHPEVPWREAIRMRNRLVHGYFDVDLDRVWQTVAGDLPHLLELLEPLLSDEGL